jgi:hypothetical protein
MTRFGYGLGGVALVLGVAWATSPVGAQGGGALTIKDIMGKAHKGTTSVLTVLGKELKAEEPGWADVQKQTKELLSLGEGLGKNTPPKGEKDSWSQLTAAYVKTARELDAAAQKKDKATAAAAQAKLAVSCKACHLAHRN